MGFNSPVPNMKETKQSKAGKSKGNKASPLQARAIKTLVEKGGSVSAAMRGAGYSPETAKTPKKLTETKAFKSVFEKAGLTEDFLANGTREMATAYTVHEREFKHRLGHDIVKIEPDSPEYKEGDANLKEMPFKTPWTDREINKAISRIRGASVLFIEDRADHRLCVYEVPDFTARRPAIDMGHKLLGSYAAEKHEHEVKHQMSDEERHRFDLIRGKNRK